MNKLIAIAAVAIACAAPVGAMGQERHELASPMVPPKRAAQDMPDNVRGAWACLAGGSVATAAAMAAGSENLINVVAGGAVAPQNRAVLAMGLAGVVFSTFCTLGQQLLPLYQYYVLGDSPYVPDAGHETATGEQPTASHSVWRSWTTASYPTVN